MPANELAMSLAPIELLPAATCTSFEFMLAFNIALCLMSLFYMAQAHKFMKIATFFEKRIVRLDECIRNLEGAETNLEKPSSEFNHFDLPYQNGPQNRLALFKKAHQNNVQSSNVVIEFKRVGLLDRGRLHCEGESSEGVHCQ
jgi:hypothetical protein